MKYTKAIERVRSGEMSRSDLVRLKRNAEQKLATGDTEAQQVLSAILEELRQIRTHLEDLPAAPSDLAARRDRQERPAA